MLAGRGVLMTLSNGLQPLTIFTDITHGPKCASTFFILEKVQRKHLKQLTLLLTSSFAHY